MHGIGARSPLGENWRSTADALANGESAVRSIDHFDTAGFPCQVAASLTHATTSDDRRIPIMLEAVSQAREAAPEADGVLGVFIGAESGLARFSHALKLSRIAGGGKSFDHALFAQNADAPLRQAIAQSQTSSAAVAQAIARVHGATGPVETVSLACASSSAALIQAVRALRLGECDVAICGGVGADVDPLMLAAFGRLGALSARGKSSPFDAQRDGFVLGEGSVAFVLSRDARDAKVEVAGTGMSLDAHHLTTPDPTGVGATRAMRAALAEAKLDTVDYVQAHGTATPLGDAIEAKSIGNVLGHGVPIGSVKGALGHWIAGAGALSIACAWEAVANGRLLPTAGLQRPDDECALNHVMGKAQKYAAQTAMANAFAFGGANCSVVLRSTNAPSTGARSTSAR